MQLQTKWFCLEYSGKDMGRKWTRWQEVGHGYSWNWGESCDGISYSSHVLLPTYVHVASSSSIIKKFIMMLKYKDS